MVSLWWPCLPIPDPQLCYSSFQHLDSCPADRTPAQESTWGLPSLAEASPGPLCRLSRASSAPAGHLPGSLCWLTPGHPTPVSWLVSFSLPFILSPGSLLPPIFPLFPLLVLFFPFSLLLFSLPYFLFPPSLYSATFYISLLPTECVKECISSASVLVSEWIPVCILSVCISTYVCTPSDSH